MENALSIKIYFLLFFYKYFQQMLSYIYSKNTKNISLEKVSKKFLSREGIKKYVNVF